MSDLLWLNVLAFLFLAWTSFLSQKAGSPRIPFKGLSKIQLGFFIAGLFVCVLALGILLWKAPGIFLSVYLKTTFSLLIAAHAWWFSSGKSRRIRVAALVLALAVILWRLSLPSAFSHNLFIASALVWIGPFLAKQNLLTRKRFFMLSAFLFFYDLAFVWLTPAASNLDISTQAIGFPFALVTWKISLGTGDLLWSSFLVSIVKTRQSRLLLAAVLVFSNVAILSWLFPRGAPFAFPLLVLWIPLGMLFLWATKA